MPEWSGQGGVAKLGAAGVDIDVDEWEWVDEAVLADVTKAKSLGRRRRKSTLLDGRVRFNIPWDSDQIPGTDVDIGAGDELPALRLLHGDSTKFVEFPFITERVTTINNAKGEVIRVVVEGYVNGPVTYPTT